MAHPKDCQVPPGLGGPPGDKKRNTSFKITNILPSRQTSNEPEEDESCDDDVEDSRNDDNVDDVVQVALARDAPPMSLTTLATTTAAIKANKDSVIRRNSSTRKAPGSTMTSSAPCVGYRFDVFLSGAPTGASGNDAFRSPAWQVRATAASAYISAIDKDKNEPSKSKDGQEVSSVPEKESKKQPKHGPQDRFKVVKIQTVLTQEMGRWSLVDYDNRSGPLAPIQPVFANNLSPAMSLTARMPNKSAKAPKTPVGRNAAAAASSASAAAAAASSSASAAAASSSASAAAASASAASQMKKETVNSISATPVSNQHHQSQVPVGTSNHGPRVKVATTTLSSSLSGPVPPVHVVVSTCASADLHDAPLYKSIVRGVPGGISVPQSTQQVVCNLPPNSKHPSDTVEIPVANPLSQSMMSANINQAAAYTSDTALGASSQQKQQSVFTSSSSQVTNHLVSGATDRSSGFLASSANQVLGAPATTPVYTNLPQLSNNNACMVSNPVVSTPLHPPAKQHAPNIPHHTILTQQQNPMQKIPQSLAMALQPHVPQQKQLPQVVPVQDQECHPQIISSPNVCNDSVGAGTAYKSITVAQMAQLSASVTETRIQSQQMVSGLPEVQQLPQYTSQGKQYLQPVKVSQKVLINQQQLQSGPQMSVAAQSAQDPAQVMTSQCQQQTVALQSSQQVSVSSYNPQQQQLQVLVRQQPPNQQTHNIVVSSAGAVHASQSQGLASISSKYTPSRAEQTAFGHQGPGHSVTQHHHVQQLPSVVSGQWHGPSNKQHTSVKSSFNYLSGGAQFVTDKCGNLMNNQSVDGSELLVERLEEISTQQHATVTAAHGPDLEGEPESASGTHQGAIDNRIEQAMDLVKSHLMNAVRSEVEELREKIVRLEDTISHLQNENTFLKQNVPNEILHQISSVAVSVAKGTAPMSPTSNTVASMLPPGTSASLQLQQMQPQLTAPVAISTTNTSTSSQLHT